MKPTKQKAQSQVTLRFFGFLHAESFCTQNAQNLMNRNATQYLTTAVFCDFSGFCVRQKQFLREIICQFYRYPINSFADENQEIYSEIHSGTH